MALIPLIVGLAFRSVGAPLVTLFAAGIAYLIAMRVLPWTGERAGAPCRPRSSRSSSCCCSAWSPTTRSSSCPRRAGGCGAARRGCGGRARGDRRTAPIVLTAGLIVAAGTARARRRQAGVLPRLRARPRRTTLISAARLGHARPGADGAVRHAAVRRARRAATAARRRSRTRTPTRTRSSGAPDARHRGPPRPPAPLRLALTRPLSAVRRTGELARRAADAALARC